MHDFHWTFRDLLHAANLRHGTHGFTSLPKEGVLRIFSPLKIRRFRPGLNPRTWIPKASTLPLDHRSRYVWICLYKSQTSTSTSTSTSHDVVMAETRYKTFLVFLRSVSGKDAVERHVFSFVTAWASVKWGLSTNHIVMIANGWNMWGRAENISCRLSVLLCIVEFTQLAVG